jgi:hypothetical protein
MLLEKISIILKLLPVLIEAIKVIESAVPGQGKGEAKLAALRGILELADVQVNTLWPQIAGVTGVLVKLLNSTGWGAKE